MTVLLCAAGGIAIQLLRQRGVYIGAHAESVGGVLDERFDPCRVTCEEFSAIDEKAFPVIDDAAGERMKEAIKKALAEKDSVGGVVECAVAGFPKGIGNELFYGIEGRLSSAMFAIPAVKGVEFGIGFAAADIRGSENNDAFRTDGREVYTETNNCGGILGGISDGMPIIFRVAVKPTPSIGKVQKSVSLSRMENTEIEIKGRHDACIVPRAVPVVQAAAALALLDLLL